LRGRWAAPRTTPDLDRAVIVGISLMASRPRPVSLWRRVMRATGAASPMIPEVIHQIFIPDEPGSADLDSDILANMKSWTEFHPHYGHRLWNLEEIRALAEEFDPGILSAIDVCAFPAMKADIARLMIMYLRGGIYVDLKLRCLTPFIDEYRDCKLVLVEHLKMENVTYNRDRHLNNSFIIAEPRHEFIRRALEDCVRNVEARSDAGVWNTTGAMVLMRLQDEFLPKDFGRFENGVGVIRQSAAYWKLFSVCGGAYNRPGRHWHEREKVESIYTDCDIRYVWNFPRA
jgi:hypothetical protein